MSYFAPLTSVILPKRSRTMRGPFSLYFSGSHACQTWAGSTTWSSTLMILGSSTTLTLASGKHHDQAGAAHPIGLQVPTGLLDIHRMSAGMRDFDFQRRFEQVGAYTAWI